MKVQLIKRPTRQVKYLAIRVLNYNEEEIDTPIANSDISKFALMDYPAEDELNLFSFEYGKLKNE